MRNLEKCPECLQRFHVEWQGKSSQKTISLILNRLILEEIAASVKANTQIK
jgi:hypothetical protein